MNFNNFLQKFFSKYENVENLHFNLTNIVYLAKEKEQCYYCFCDERICCYFIKQKCTLCSFCDLMFKNDLINNMCAREFLLRNRQNEKELMKLANLFWPYFRKMTILKPDFLDFLIMNINGHFMIIEMLLIYQ